MNQNHPSRDVRRAAGIYSKPVLRIYDLLVVRVSNSLAWRCRSTRMLEQYRQRLGRRHLDVGPGTGWYLANTEIAADSVITLMDLNANSLHTASARLADKPHVRLNGDVLEPLAADVGPFDSIGVNYLMHCLPGTWAQKGRAFANLAPALTDDGVLFGSTILGSGVRHNRFGRALLALYNRLGIFHNRNDDVEGLRASLAESFGTVQIDMVETVAIFSASAPIRGMYL